MLSRLALNSWSSCPISGVVGLQEYDTMWGSVLFLDHGLSKALTSTATLSRLDTFYKSIKLSACSKPLYRWASPRRRLKAWGNEACWEERGQAELWWEADWCEYSFSIACSWPPLLPGSWDSEEGKYMPDRISSWEISVCCRCRGLLEIRKSQIHQPDNIQGTAKGHERVKPLPIGLQRNKRSAFETAPCGFPEKSRIHENAVLVGVFVKLGNKIISGL